MNLGVELISKRSGYSLNRIAPKLVMSECSGDICRSRTLREVSTNSSFLLLLAFPPWLSGIARKPTRAKSFFSKQNRRAKPETRLPFGKYISPMKIPTALRRLPLLLPCLFFSKLLFAQWTFHTGQVGSAPYQVLDAGPVRWLCTEYGLFRSNDRGQKYQQIQGLPALAAVGGMWLKGDSIAVVVNVPDPANPGTERPVMYRSANQGASWQSQPIGITYELLYRGVWISGDTIVIGTIGRIWRSVDGGNSFELNGPTPAQGASRFNFSEKGLLALAPGGLFRSYDLGSSWELIRPLTGFGNIARAGDTLFVATSTDSIQLSFDLGNTWQTAPPNPAVGSNFVSIGRQGRLYAAFKQIHYSDDWGKTWQKMSDGCGSSIFFIYETEQGTWGLAGVGLLRVDPATGLLTIDQEGSLGDYNQYRIEALGPRLFSTGIDDTWSTTTDGIHWAPMRAIPSDGLVYKVVERGDTLVMLCNLKLFYSTNQGISWTPIVSPFTSPAALAASGNVLLVGDSKGVWRSTAVTGPWTKAAGSPESAAHFLTNPGRWFALSNFNQLYFSDDLGESWTFRAQLGQSSLFTLHDIQQAAGYLFHFSNTGLLRSPESDGINWSPVQGPAQEDFYSGIALKGPLLVLGTRKNGLLSSSDFGEHWYPYPLPGVVAVPSVANWQGRLIVSAIENGLWISDVGPLTPYHARAFFDANQNGQRDAGEKPFAGLVVRAKSGAFASSDTSGLIRVAGEAPSDSLLVFNSKPYITVTPAQLLLDTPLDTPEIAVYHPEIRDLRISLVNVGVLVPGRPTDFLLHCENVGTETQDATVRFFPSEKTKLIAAEDNPVFWSADSAVWLLPGIKPGQTRTLRCAVETANTVGPGTTLSLESSIDPQDGDAYIKDNTSGLRLVVRGSYDPNDKTARLGDRISPQQVADSLPLEFVVRFQNTGNYPASFIRIRDTLSARFDPSTFVFQASSHPCRWQLLGGGVLDFFFDNIELPDSTSDEPNSHGFVAFSVQPYPGLQLGDTLRNTAFIYFDYNAPVQTNTTQTVVSEPVATFAPWSSAAEPELVCFPNPAVAELHLAWTDAAVEGASGQIWIWDANGRLMRQLDASGQNLQMVSLAGWPAGWYRVAWLRGGVLRWGRFLRG